MCELEAMTTAHNHPVEYEKKKEITVKNACVHLLRMPNAKL